MNAKGRCRVEADRKPKNNLSYNDAMHGVQTGIAFDISAGSKIGEPKHLRVGIDSAHITDLAMTRLLIRKGIITEEEYLEEVRIAANLELDRYEERNPTIKFR